MHKQDEMKPPTRPKRTKAGMLRSQKAREMDFVGRALLDTIRKERASGYHSQETLDFWERRLWAWNDEARRSQWDVLELDPETRAAVESVARFLSSSGEIRKTDNNPHSLRGFMLSAIRLVCDAVINGRGVRFCGWRLDRLIDRYAGTFRLRHKTEDERAAERLISQSYRTVWDPATDEDFRPGWTPAHDDDEDDE